jgi:hypothetical protein
MKREINLMLTSLRILVQRTDEAVEASKRLENETKNLLLATARLAKIVATEQPIVLIGQAPPEGTVN